MKNKILAILLATMAIIIGLYPVKYFIVDRNLGLLSTKSSELLTNVGWNAAFYVHIILGGQALLIGWAQFSENLRRDHLQLHRNIGKLYVLSVMLSAVAGFYIAFFATGGIIASLGFLCLAIIWFYTTGNAYISIRSHKVAQHQKMMVYSYAACFGAVTLRLWLPMLSAVFGDFVTAYRIVAWLCWVPNMLVAHILVKRILPGN